MSDYIYAVVVKDTDGKPVVCEASSWPELHIGDRVLFGTQTTGEVEGICLSMSKYFDREEQELLEQELLAAAAGQQLPFPRVRGVISVRRFEYDDEKTPEGADTPADAMDG